MAMPFRIFVAAQALGVTALNAATNATYTWWLWRDLGPVRLFGPDAIAYDLASTPLLIAVLSTLLGTASIHQSLRSGSVAVPAMRRAAVLQILPQGILARSALLGVVAAIALGVPVFELLQASGMDALPLGGAIALKVAITVPLSLLIVPLVVVAGLTDVQRPVHQPAAT